MRRHLFNFLTATSLLLCAAALALWVRSDSGSDWVSFEKVRPPLEEPGTRYFGASTLPGAVTFEASRTVYGVREFPRQWWARVDRGWTATCGRTANTGGTQGAMTALRSSELFLGIRSWDQSIISPSQGETFRARGAIVPLWIITVLTLVTPAVWSARWYRARRRQRRRRAGLCPDCAYDLTGNVSGACPECGRQVITGGPRTSAPAPR